MQEAISSHDLEVSVVMAVKNESTHIEEAVTSIASQDGVRTEVIVVDDGSDDDTKEQVTRLQERYINIRLLENPGRGKVSAFNYGIAKSRAPFVCIFAGDDVMPAGSLAIRHGVLKDQPEDIPVAGISKIKTMSDDPRFDGQVVPKQKGKGNLSGQSPLMNRKMVEIMFPVPEELPNEDTWMELFMIYMPELQIISNDVICCNWRVHGGNTYNMKRGFDEYKRAMAVRYVNGYEKFYGEYKAQIPEQKHQEIEAIIRCNRSYDEGDVWGILASGAPLRHRLRMLSTATPMMFNTRRAFYKLFLGS